MKRVFRIILVLVALSVIGAIIAYVILGNISNIDEYELGKDVIKSIKMVVEKREVTYASTETSDGKITKKIEYKSDTVQDDLMEYTYYLRTEGGFHLTKEMDLTVASSTIEMEKTSVDEGKIIKLTIEYNPSSYTITIQK